MKHVDNALRKTLFILLGLISLFWLFWTFKYLFTDNLRSTRYIFLFVTILLVLLIFFLNKNLKTYYLRLLNLFMDISIGLLVFFLFYK